MLLSITLQVFAFSESGLVRRSGLDCGTLQIDSAVIFCCPPLIVNVYIHSMANAREIVGRLQVLFMIPFKAINNELGNNIYNICISAS